VRPLRAVVWDAANGCRVRGVRSVQCDAAGCRWEDLAAPDGHCGVWGGRDGELVRCDAV
jgi:hypothetical protein